MPTDPFDVPAILDKTTNMWHRPDLKELHHLIATKSKWQDYVLSFLTEQRIKGPVLNVGAHIGYWSRQLTNHGYSVVAYEAIPSTAALSKRNAPKAKTVSGAVGLKDGKVVFNVGKLSGSASTTSYRGWHPITVKCHDIRKVLKTVKPTVITFDCEGGEYEIVPQTKFPSCVKLLDIELHLQKSEWRAKTHVELCDFLKSTGWKLLRLTKVRNHWACGSVHSLWQRS